MAGAKTTQKLEVVGLSEALKATRGLPKNANRMLRAATKEIAGETMREAQREANSLGGVQALAGQSLRARSDRVPSIVAGGAMKVGHHKGKAGQIFFGAEFGGGARPTTHQFPRHRGQHGYFLWPTIRARKQHDLRIYYSVLQAVAAYWAE